MLTTLVTGVLAAAAAGCTSEDVARAPPLDRFYYPMGLAVARPGPGDGFLYVASGNLDKRFRAGTLIAVDLDAIPLPPFGDPVPPNGPPTHLDLKLGERSVLEIANFATEMRAAVVTPSGEGPRLRLFIPSRAEENRLHIVDTDGAALTCLASADSRDCGDPSMDLTSLASDADGRPQAKAPGGVGISATGRVVVTHQTAAKLPQSTEIGEYYVVTMDAAEPVLATQSFLPITSCVNGNCFGGSESAVVGARYAYVTGRVGRTNGAQALPANLLRWVDVRPPELGGTGRVGTAGIEHVVQLFEGRGIVMRADESRLYLIARGIDTIVASGPSMLLAIDVKGPQTDAPTFVVSQALTLPERCNEAVLLPRGAASELVAMTCSDAGAVVLYDSEQRILVANVRGVGNQPFGLAVDPRGAGARFYVGSFVDGQVAVLDLPDVARPAELRVVARLGAPQTCIVRAQDSRCVEVAP